MLEFHQKHTPVVSNEKRPAKMPNSHVPTIFEMETPNVNGKRHLLTGDSDKSILPTATSISTPVNSVGELFSHAAMLRLLQVRIFWLFRFRKTNLVFFSSPQTASHSVREIRLV